MALGGGGQDFHNLSLFYRCCSVWKRLTLYGSFKGESKNIPMLIKTDAYGTIHNNMKKDKNRLL